MAIKCSEEANGAEERLRKRLGLRIHLLDGAMGTMVAGGGFPDLLSLTRPALVRAVHLQYLAVGADIITTNTFNSNSLSLIQYGKGGEAAAIARAGARIAREAVEEHVRRRHEDSEVRPDQAASESPLVAGSIGPTHISLSRPGKERVDAATMADAFREQAAALIEGGVDILLLETIYDLKNARAAIRGAEEAFRQTGIILPIVLSAAVSESERLFSGERIEEFVEVAASVGPLSIGLNCMLPEEELARHVGHLAGLTDVPLTIYPNAGIPDRSGAYPVSPELFGSLLEPLTDIEPVRIVGGCCGTTPAHIASLGSTVRRHLELERRLHRELDGK